MGGEGVLVLTQGREGAAGDPEGGQSGPALLAGNGCQ